MKIVIDKTGFPLIKIGNLGSVHLWPVTNVQFERFICETNRFEDTWYDSILKLNPRVSYKYFDKQNYEGLFVTGVTPQEALGFARWLGEGFELPTVDEWRRFYRMLSDESIPEMPTSGLSTSAYSIWLKLKGFLKGPRKFALVQDGIVEWAKKGDKHIGLGAPRSSFHPNAFDPLNDEVTPLQERVFYFGFRLIRRHGNAN